MNQHELIQNAWALTEAIDEAVGNGRLARVPPNSTKRARRS